MRRIAFLVCVAMLGFAIASAEVIDDKSLSPGPANIGSLPDASGGPDDFGYIFADNAEAACSSLYSYVDITATGTGAGLAGVDDGHAGPFPFGFSFDFYGTTYTDFYVGSNGVVFFVDIYLGLGNVCPLPAVQGTYGVDTFMGVYHDDLEVQTNGEIYYQNFATCPVGNAGQCTVIQFHNMCDFGSTDDNMEFEVVLVDDGTIVYLYEQPVNDDASQTNGASATVGIQGSPAATPVYAIEYSCNVASLSSGLAIAFAPPTAITAGAPSVCAQQVTPTPSGPQPVPTATNTGLIVLVILVAAAALVLLGRRAV
jgi:hypothetical protein